MRFPTMTRQRMLVHPNNRELLLAGLSLASPDAVPALDGLPVDFCETVPERSRREEWNVPIGDRFCEYGPEDEAWMRPLGIGVSVVDEPVFFLIDDPTTFTFYGLRGLEAGFGRPRRAALSYL